MKNGYERLDISHGKVDQKKLAGTNELSDHKNYYFIQTSQDNEIRLLWCHRTLSNATEASSLYRPIYPPDISAVLLYDGSSMSITFVPSTHIVVCFPILEIFM